MIKRGWGGGCTQHYFCFFFALENLKIARPFEHQGKGSRLCLNKYRYNIESTFFICFFRGEGAQARDPPPPWIRLWGNKRITVFVKTLYVRTPGAGPGFLGGGGGEAQI